MTGRDNLFRFTLIGVMAFLMTACQSTSYAVPEPVAYNYSPIRFAGAKATPAERQHCETVGEFIQNVGMAGIDICHQDVPDAGKICRSSDECLSECMADEDADIGKIATGQCSMYETNYGCNSRIENGRVEPMLCVD